MASASTWPGPLVELADFAGGVGFGVALSFGAGEGDGGGQSEPGDQEGERLRMERRRMGNLSNADGLALRPIRMIVGAPERSPRLPW